MLSSNAFHPSIQEMNPENGKEKKKAGNHLCFSSNEQKLIKFFSKNWMHFTPGI